MQDAFRRMIEKKMLEKVQAELAKKHEEDEVYKREVQIRTAQREKELEGEKQRIIMECDVRLKTANEARQDAEQMAKENTVKNMIGASLGIGMIESADPVNPEALFNHHNQMLIQSGLIALNQQQMQEFDTVWAEATVQKIGLEGTALHNFCESMLQEEGYRA